MKLSLFFCPWEVKQSKGQWFWLCLVCVCFALLFLWGGLVGCVVGFLLFWGVFCMSDSKILSVFLYVIPERIIHSLLYPLEHCSLLI